MVVAGGAPLNLWYKYFACDQKLTQWDLMMSKKGVNGSCKQEKKQINQIEISITGYTNHKISYQVLLFWLILVLFFQL